MHLILTLMALMLLVPAALAGIGRGLLDAMANLECLSAALPHASALFTEMAPMAPAAVMLLAGMATLGLAVWLIVRAVNS